MYLKLKLTIFKIEIFESNSSLTINLKQDNSIDHF